MSSSVFAIQGTYKTRSKHLLRSCVGYGCPCGAKRLRGSGGLGPQQVEDNGLQEKDWRSANPFLVAPSDIISNLFLKDLDRIWELKKWIPDPCNPYLHNLNPDDKEVI